MKRRKTYSVIGILAILTLLLTACASAKNDSNTSSVGYETSTTSTSSDGSTSMNFSFDTNTGTTADEAPAADTGKEGSSALSTTSSFTSGETVQPEQDKIIRTFTMDVETQEFDSLITKINAEIKQRSGYVESSDINGKGYNNNGGTRYGSIVARIPSEKVDEFVGTVNDSANVVSQKESTENVSLKYIEAESRIETLKIEQDRLFAILEKEINLDNIITLESRLSDIRYELQNYESQLRYYDNQVAYSTVTLSIQEVVKFTPVTEAKQSVGTRIKNGLSNTMYHLSEGFKNFLVWFVVNLPYLLIWGIVIAVAVIIIRRTMKKNKAGIATLPTTPMYQNQSEQNQQGSNQTNQNNNQ
ncbi:MAG TPA: DUF4349 domain-containing protein [Mobilitalea sp.]|nr:DUF4349 domain-containing protein [Mobilitalea sp.]